MPANLPPQFYELEKEYRGKKDIEEKIEILKKMYAVMPKHKGTDKLQADIKAKISKLKEELDYQKKIKGKGALFISRKKGLDKLQLLVQQTVGNQLYLFHYQTPFLMLLHILILQ